MEDGCETKQKRPQNQSFSSDTGGLSGLRLGLRATGLAVERGGRPVVGGVSFTLEPGHYGHLLVDKGIPDVRFFGKPFPEVYAMIEESLRVM